MGVGGSNKIEVINIVKYLIIEVARRCRIFQQRRVVLLKLLQRLNGVLSHHVGSLGGGEAL